MRQETIVVCKHHAGQIAKRSRFTQDVQHAVDRVTGSVWHAVQMRTLRYNDIRFGCVIY